MAFTFPPDLNSMNDVEIALLKSYATFGQSISDDPGGDTRVLLYILGHGDFDFFEEKMDWFQPDSAVYQRTVNQLKELMD